MFAHPESFLLRTTTFIVAKATKIKKSFVLEIKHLQLITEYILKQLLNELAAILILGLALSSDFPTLDKFSINLSKTIQWQEVTG